MSDLERLGYSEGSKLLIIHADDLGMCHSVNQASIDALEKGTVTCGSIMINCPWSPEIAKYYRDYSEIDVGVHVTLNSEWERYKWGPVAPDEKVPGLVDSNGYLPKSVEQVKEKAKPEEVEREIRAQVKKAFDFGIEPTHLDTHMGTVYERPEFFSAYCRIAKEFDITPMVVSPESTTARERIEENSKMKFSINQYKKISSNFPNIDELISSVEEINLKARKKHFKNIIKNLPSGLNQVIVHLGYDRSELQGITENWKLRYNDYRIFTDPKMRKFIEKQKIKLIGWKDIS